MSGRVTRKWRPSLTLVLAGTLAAVLGLPLLGIAYFRLAGDILGWAETSWLIGWIAVVTTVVLAFLLWRLVLRPVQALTAYAGDVSRGTGQAAPPVHFGTPEISQLGEAVLNMGTTLRGREAVLRTYADHVTHELKSPLTVVQGAAELLADPELPAADRDRMLGNIGQATARMQDLLEAQRALAHAAEPMPPGRCWLSEAVVPAPDVTVVTDGEVPLSAEVLGVVLTHLIGNARAHGATEITVAMEGDALWVSDNGPGVSAGNRDRIFDPFFTTRRDDGGTGMGLAIVCRILEAQGASIALATGPGAVFEIGF